MLRQIKTAGGMKNNTSIQIFEFQIKIKIKTSIPQND
jgi:hypothetical protein